LDNYEWDDYIETATKNRLPLVGSMTSSIKGTAPPNVLGRFKGDEVSGDQVTSTAPDKAPLFSLECRRCMRLLQDEAVSGRLPPDYCTNCIGHYQVGSSHLLQQYNLGV
jgi:hypothetical protein